VREPVSSSNDFQWLDFYVAQLRRLSQCRSDPRRRANCQVCRCRRVLHGKALNRSQNAGKYASELVFGELNIHVEPILMFEQERLHFLC
jgi:hypothetical protein